MAFMLRLTVRDIALRAVAKFRGPRIAIVLPADNDEWAGMYRSRRRDLLESRPQVILAGAMPARFMIVCALDRGAEVELPKSSVVEDLDEHLADEAFVSPAIR